MADALGTAGGVVSAVDHRLNQAGLIAPQTSSLAVRTGVMVGPGSTTLVTGTSATGTMTVSIAAHHWVTTRGTADGVYLGTKEAAGTVNIAAAPGANSRIDVVYVKQNDAGSSISPDGSTGEVYGVVTGTAAVSPTKPSIPVGAVELATVTVAVGATSTNGAGVTITQTARQTVARGARVPVRTQAERDDPALIPYPGLEVYRLDTGDVELCTVAGPPAQWATVYKSGQPTVKPHALLHGTGTQSIATGTGTLVNLNTEIRATGMTTTVASGRITAVTTGIYLVSGVGSFAGGATARRLAMIAKNGAPLFETQGRVDPSNASTTPVPTATYPVALAAGEYVQLYVQQDSGVALNVNRDQSFLQATYIAPA